MKKVLHIIADYGVGDPAFTEVEQRLLSLYPEFYCMRTAVPSFNTIATGFWIYQLALGDHPEGMMIFSNTAPRKDDKKKRQDNSGEKFIYARLQNGIEITAVNSGFSFAFIKPYIQQLKALNIPNQGSQFRSRDFYPKAAAAVAQQNNDIFGENLAIEAIPDAPTNRIAWVDGYGNIKTSIRKQDVSFNQGEKMKVTIDGVTRTALVSGGSFSVSEGELALSFGSSGYDNSFLELFLRGGNAYEHFGKPSWYTKIKIK